MTEFDCGCKFIFNEDDDIILVPCEQHKKEKGE